MRDSSLDRIYISNNQDKIPFTRSLRDVVKGAVKTTLEYENFTRAAEVSVTITDDNHIAELNLEYREKKGATDVLSFPLMDLELNGPEVCAIGDVVLSLQRAVAQAEEYGHSLEKEVAFLVIHSVLHLLGYDHENEEKDKGEMRKREKKIESKLNINKQ